MHRHEWSQLISHGILYDIILDILWRAWSKQSSILISLMVKFGLFVPLISNDNATSRKQYLVPALLSELPDADYNFGSDWCDNVNRHSTTCVFVFSSSASIANFPTITQDELLTSGFLPSGLFERIIGKALIWSQSTSRGGFHVRDAVIHKNLAILQFGSQRFRLITYPQVGCIRVDIDGRAPLVVHDRLLEQVQKVISECMKSLVVFTALLYTGPNPPTHDDYTRFLLPSFHGQSQEGMMLLPLNVLRDIVSSKSSSFLICIEDTVNHFHYKATSSSSFLDTV